MNIVGECCIIVTVYLIWPLLCAFSNFMMQEIDKCTQIYEDSTNQFEAGTAG